MALQKRGGGGGQPAAFDSFDEVAVPSSPRSPDVKIPASGPGNDYNEGSKKNLKMTTSYPWAAWLFGLFGVLAVAFGNYIGIVGGLKYFYLSFDTPLSTPPNTNCSCSCWDGIVKENAPVQGDKSQYYSIYINTDKITVIIIFLSILYIVASFTYFQTWWKAAAKGRLRVGLFIVSLFLMYPNLYNYWCTFNYFNDRWFNMLGHQLYFGASEFFVTATVRYNLDKKVKFAEWAVSLCFSVSFVHIIQLYGVDEPMTSGNAWARNLFFFLADVAVVLYFGKRILDKKMFNLSNRRNLILFIVSSALQFALINFWIPTPA